MAQDSQVGRTSRLVLLRLLLEELKYIIIPEFLNIPKQRKVGDRLLQGETV